MDTIDGVLSFLIRTRPFYVASPAPYATVRKEEDLILAGRGYRAETYNVGCYMFLEPPKPSNMIFRIEENTSAYPSVSYVSYCSMLLLVYLLANCANKETSDNPV